MTTRKSTDELVKWGERAGYVAATIAGGFTGCALHEMLHEAGLGNTGTVLAVAGAGAITLSYSAFTRIICRGVAPLPVEQRRKATPAILAGAVAIGLGSAYPNVMVSGGGVAAGIEDRTYVAAVSSTGDKLKEAAHATLQLEGAYDNGIRDLDAFTQSSLEGLTSAPGAGPLVALAAARKESLKQAKADLAPSKERIVDEIAKFDIATDAMRASLLVNGKSPAERRVQMQRAGDDARSAGIGIGGAVPIIAFEALAESLMGPQVEPRWSANPDIRRSQVEGFAQYRELLKRIGKSIKQRTGDFQKAVKQTVPVYDPAPHSVLIIKHAYALTNIYAVFLLLDGFPLILFAVACAMYDALRQGDEGNDPWAAPGPGMRHSSTGQDGSSLGPHPHPRATAARAASQGKSSKVEEGV
jgi:hypothetical protein